MGVDFYRCVVCDEVSHEDYTHTCGDCLERVCKYRCCSGYMDYDARQATHDQYEDDPSYQGQNYVFKKYYPDYNCENCNKIAEIAVQKEACGVELSELFDAMKQLVTKKRKQDFDVLQEKVLKIVNTK